VSGFGQDGPYRDRPAHDLSYVALSGMLDPADGDVPVAPPIAVGDLAAGLFATIASLVGLLTKDRVGAPQFDVSMSDALVSLMTTHLVPVLNRLGPPEFPKEPGYGIFETIDSRHLTLSIAHEDHFWRRLCRVVGMEDVADLDGVERLRRGDELGRRLATAIATRRLDEWSAALTEADVPHAPVLRLEEVPDDPHVRARGLVVEVPVGKGRRARRHVRQPSLVGGFGGGPRGHAPLLGEHTREVLRECGLGDEAIDDLLRTGAARERGGDERWVHAAVGSA
jgi:crotonobetainyl-CoA:carnitine CoA-transferase CaiB-like acyl-CoA transferase